MVARVRRKASVNWSGSVRAGHGAIALSSKAATDLRLSLETRKTDDAPSTSPEEMLAAAHASCFAMSVRSVLDGEGFSGRLAADAAVRVETTCVLAIDGASWKIEEMILAVGIDGLSAGDIAGVIATADTRCPISAAIRGNVKITTAVLEGVQS
jgi:osmotically inducible protein OsmC